MAYFDGSEAEHRRLQASRSVASSLTRYNGAVPCRHLTVATFWPWIAR